MRLARALVLSAVLCSALPGVAAAQIYRWVDDQGVPHYTEGLHSVPERLRGGAVLLPMRNAPAGASAPAAPASGGPAATGEATIKFSPGQRIMVDTRINGTTSARLLLDTGADRTVLAPRVVAAAGISLTRGTQGGTIKSATGTAQVQAVPVESIEVGGARVDRLVVISHDVDQEGVDGLLGRDFLDRFTVTIDNAQGVVTLTPKR